MSLSFNNQQSDLPSIPAPEKLHPVSQNGTPDAVALPEPRKLAPSLWLRAMTDFDAPFGRDGLPTVWG